MIAMYTWRYVCIYIMFETTYTYMVHFYPNSSQNYPSIVICVCHTSDRHRTAFVMATKFHFLGAVLCCVLSHSQSQTQSFFLSFFFRACSIALICVGLSLSVRSFFHLYLCANTHKYLYHDLTENSKDYFNIVKVQKVLFRSICFGFLSQLNYTLSCSAWAAPVWYRCYGTRTNVGVYRTTHAHIFLYTFVLHRIQYVNVQPKFRSFFRHPIFFSKTIAIHIPWTCVCWIQFQYIVPFVPCLFVCLLYTCTWYTYSLHPHVGLPKRNVTQAFRFIDYLIYFVHDEPD